MTGPFRFVTLKSNVNFDSRIFRSSKTPLSTVPAWGLHTIFNRMNNECNRKAFCYVQQTLEPAPCLPPPLPPPLKSTPVVYAYDNPHGYCVRMSALSFAHCIKSCILTESFGRVCVRGVELTQSETFGIIHAKFLLLYKDYSPSFPITLPNDAISSSNAS